MKFNFFFSAMWAMTLVSSSAFSFEAPPYIEVAKPTPVATRTVCALGCDYTSIEAADQQAQPGWSVKIKAGTYSDTTWNSSGTPGNEIVIEAFGDGDVIINSTGTSRFYLSGSYVIIDGGTNRELIFDGAGQNDQQITVYPYNSSHHNIISRVKIRNSFGSGANIQPRGDYFKLFNSEIFGSGSVGVYGADGDYHEIRNNIIYNNAGTGVQYNPHGTDGDACDEVKIAGNAIYNNGFTGVSGERPGISILSDPHGNRLYDVYIYNNMIWGNKDGGIQVSSYSNINVRIFNNTVYNNVDRGFYIANGVTVDIKNNIVWNNGSSTDTNWIPASWGAYFGSNCTTCANNLLADPSFLSTNQNDINFMFIDDASPAYNAGVDLTASPMMSSYNGLIRSLDGGFDVGAYEVGSSSPVIKKIILQ